MRRSFLLSAATSLACLSPAVAQPAPAVLPPIPVGTPAADAMPNGPACGKGCDPSAALAPDFATAADDAPTLWFRGEYLLWWLKQNPAPTLVTTGPAGAAPVGPGGVVGALGTPGTTVLNDGRGMLDNPFSGGRFTFGAALNPQATCGIEGSYFFLGRQGDSSTISSANTPVIARPFFNTSTGTPDAELVAFPGLATGTVRVDSSARLQGAEANLIGNCYRSCRGRLDVIGGFRWINLDEGLTVTEDIQAATNPALGGLSGARILVRDSFQTRNDFYGGQLGLRGQVYRGRWFLDGSAKVALGGVRERVSAFGSTTVIPPGGLPVTAPGGLLALPSNSGVYSRDEFAVVPEVGLNVGYQLTNGIRAFAGYNFLYISDVARPGSQVDPRLNVTQVPTNIVTGGAAAGPGFPLPGVRSTDFWAQGINFGLLVTY